MTAFVTLMEPANHKPRFSGIGPWYVTSFPGTRGSSFYYVPNVDPQVITTDEATKQPIAATELAAFALPIVGVTKNIGVPVLDVSGAKDVLFCGILATDVRKPLFSRIPATT